MLTPSNTKYRTKLTLVDIEMDSWPTSPEGLPLDTRVVGLVAHCKDEEAFF